MKIIKLILLITLVLAGGIALTRAGSPDFILMINGQKTNIKTVTHEGKIYVLLEDLSNTLDLPLEINPKQKTANLTVNKAYFPLQPSSVTGSKPQNNAFWGQVTFQTNKDVIVPLRGLRVSLYKKNPSFTEKETIEQVRKTFCEGSSIYFDTHGLVREAVTDSSGYYTFKDVPSGSYEVVACYLYGNNKAVIWWIEVKVESKKQALEINLTPSNIIY